MSTKKVVVLEIRECVLVKLEGRITSTNSHEVEAKLKAITDRNCYKIIIDMSGVEYISSAGLRVLINFHKVCRRWGRGAIHFLRPSPWVQDTLDLAGLTSPPFFKIFKEVASAIGNF